jgi:phospholipase C
MNSRHASVATFVLVSLASPIAYADQEVSIASDAFSGVFLRLDANGVPHAFQPSGAGTVNGQFGSFTWEKFCLRPRGGMIAIESVAFPGFFLRLDGSAVNNTFHPSGAGVVNVQWGDYAWEHFWPRPWGGNKFTYESNAFPNVFLRLDGTGVTHFLGAGGGKANAQFAAYSWEHFTQVPAGTC